MSTTNIHKISGDIDVAGEIKKNGVTIDTDDIVFSSVNEIAIGNQAGETSQSGNSVAVGRQAGQTTQGNSTVAMGYLAGNDTQGFSSVAVGVNAGETTQGLSSVAVGREAGQTTQGNNAVAVGYLAGNSGQGDNAVAVGVSAGQTSQAQYAVAVGVSAGQTSQAQYAVAIGSSAGEDGQGGSTVAIGRDAGKTSQGNQAIAIGRNAGKTSQGSASVAVGYLAGQTSQGANSIILNATGVALDSTTASSFHVKPVRGGNFAASALAYTADGEIVEETGTHFDASGNVGIGKTDPGYALDVVGDIYASGDVIMFSDERKKTNIEVIPNALEKVLQLRGVTFEKLDDGNRRHSGIIAQEVEKVLPEVVYTAEDGTKSVAYGNLVGLLIEAIKELAGK